MFRARIISPTIVQNLKCPLMPCRLETSDLFEAHSRACAFVEPYEEGLAGFPILCTSDSASGAAKDENFLPWFPYSTWP